MNTKVVPLRGMRPPETDERLKFCLARRAMNQAFAEWLGSAPPSLLIQQEIDDTLGVLMQLHDMRRGA